MHSVSRLLLLPSFRYGQIRYLNTHIFDIHPEVKSALAEHRPIVACETAILTHGLPRPINIETCLHIEQIIRENGSIPATIAILNGRIKVGLTQNELEQLGSSNHIEKASRRDLSYLISHHASAGTTVAATMLIAHRCGIRLFATGGIGGVHRDSNTTNDISSDLDELGRYLFCKRCFQFYSNEQIKTHDCQQRKIDELQSLEQLIPPDITEQQQDFNPKDYVNDHDSTSTTRMTYFGLPKLTDSIIEIKNTDGKRLFRCPLCFNFYVNRSGLNRHYITHSSQDLWKVECQYCGRRYSRKDSLKYHMKKEHGDIIMSDWTGKDTNNSFYHPSNLLDVDSISSSSNEKEHIETDDIVLVT
ncbi:unnamed protein product [Adineta steineri]|uniref:C2H2-type domain-containing protein n=2 Tax=Adineta steineri TaxID=433720 RepID=A0A813ZWY1_9BILA|nr:unnamed protein product [Adineta steineri]